MYSYTADRGCFTFDDCICCTFTEDRKDKKVAMHSQALVLYDNRFDTTATRSQLCYNMNRHRTFLKKENQCLRIEFLCYVRLNAESGLVQGATCASVGWQPVLFDIEWLDCLSKDYFFFCFFSALFRPLTSFFRRGSTILYLPFTPLGLPWPLLWPPARMTFTGCFFFPDLLALAMSLLI